jgi:hypothetical protein
MDGSFLQPFGLLALLGAPLVVLLHLLRKRRREKRVSAAFLFATRDALPQEGPRIDRLRRSASLWLETLAALLLGLLVAAPRGCSDAQREHVVVVLDGSASMSAGGTLEAARAAVREHVAGAGDSAVVTLVASGRRPTVLLGPRAPRAELDAALARYAPGLPAHDLEPALDLAAHIGDGGDGGDGGECLLVTDAEPHASSARPAFHAVGRRLANSGFVHAARVPGEDAAGGDDQVFVTIGHFSDAPRETTLAVAIDSGEERVSALSLEPDSMRTLALVAPRDATIRIAMETDALALDDAVTLPPRPGRTLGVASSLGAGLERSLGLTAEAPLDRLLAVLGDAVLVPAERAALRLEPSSSRTAARSGIVLALRDEDSAPDRDGSIALVSPFLLEKQHPLLRGVSLEGVILVADPARPADGTPLVSSGNLALLSEREDSSFELAIDPLRSTLHRSPDWPLLLFNVGELARTRQPGLERTVLPLGEALTWRAAGEASFEWITPRGERRTLRSRGDLVLDDLADPGLHVLRRDDGTRAEVFAMLADPAESDLRTRASAREGAGAAASRIAAEDRGPERALLLAILLLLALDVAVLRRARGIGVPA